LKRFIAEQHPDGFWGELTADAPTIGYNALTLTAVALYYEHSRDPLALKALERATRFHAAFTYANGEPSELMNDRNRHWFVSPWAHFAFSHVPAGRRLVRRFSGMDSTMETLGRRAQNGLYWHDGAAAPPAPWTGRMPVVLRQHGPWTVTLSGLTGAAPTHSQWFLDRQSHVSVYHERLGLIVSGAPSKRQPELAQFAETVALDGARHEDKIALAYPGFTATLQAAASPSYSAVGIHLKPHGPKPPQQVRVALQLALHADEGIESASGQRAVLGRDRLEWRNLGGWIRHHGWTMQLPPDAVLTWPHFGYNPYRAAPDDAIGYAIGLVAWQEPLGEWGASPTMLRITVP
jgi:hypothetical protein